MAGEQPGEVPPPFALAMVVCDSVWTDPGTGKKFILGCFTTIGAKTFPATHPFLSLYILLTGGRGKVSFKIQIVDVDEEREPFGVSEGEIEFADPRGIVEVTSMILGTVFNAAGEYRIQLFVSGQFIMERRLLLIQIPEVPA